MSEQVGRAGFHAVHTKRASERGAILDEMMRELDPDAVVRWAARNPSIVVADEVENEAYVNDGEGGFRRCTDKQEVLDYGEARLRRVRRKIAAPKIDPTTGEEKGGTTTTTMLVTHLPKSLCVEVSDYYPVLYKKGPRKGEQKLDEDGQPRFRSRWVARDKDEARRYFDDVGEIIAIHLSPGGHDGVLGRDDQYSETTPHAQWLLDAFAEDPKHEGSLKAAASSFWFAHKGRMAELHRTLKAELIACGWDISPDFDEKRHAYGHAKAEYGDIEDERGRVTERAQRVVEDDAKLNDWDDRLRDKRDALRDKEEGLDERERALAGLEKDTEETRTRLELDTNALDEQRRAFEDDEVPRLRRKAVTEGAREGREQVTKELGHLEGTRRALESQLRALAEHEKRLQETPQLFDEFLDREDKNGRSYRRLFERFVDQRLAQFEREHDVAGEMTLEAGDREQFIRDGGEVLGAEVTQLKIERERERGLGK